MKIEFLTKQRRNDFKRETFSKRPIAEGTELSMIRKGVVHVKFKKRISFSSYEIKFNIYAERIGSIILK